MQEDLSASPGNAEIGRIKAAGPVKFRLQWEPLKVCVAVKEITKKK